MGKPAYIATNLAVDALSIVIQNQSNSTVYPASNLTDGHLGIPAWVTLNGGNILIDLTASPSVTYDSVFVGNHGVSATGSINVVSLDESVSPPTSATAFGTWRARNMWINTGTQLAKEFVRIEITDMDGTEDIILGEIVVGLRTLFPRACQWGIVDQQVNTGITHYSAGGLSYDYELSSYGILEPSFFFPRSEFAAFKAFSDAVGRSPFVYIPDVDLPDAFYVKKERGFDPEPIVAAKDTSGIAQWYRWTLRMRMESEGLTAPIL